ncbi:unnamed protein product [Pseudo-nitzschia multistriata]|uniref:Uncharacterized protein n=1 Tax=Pseudo-nitzschia multistriata TaxID=183589 RepID=A0A448ZT24_9STRA|nr:unnamed protein product [Pseudo-nitzschia multistriata]
MNKPTAFLLLALALARGSLAFTTSGPRSALSARAAPLPVSEMPTHQGATSTSLNLKVKVDPNAKTKNSAGNAKAAAYGGSIAIAALLPVIFLVWSVVNKGN